MSKFSGKFIIFGISSLIALAPACVNAFVFSNQSLVNPISLKAKTFNIEYGTLADFSPKRFLNKTPKVFLSKMSFITLIDSSIPTSSTINESNSEDGKYNNKLPVELGKSYPAIGSYHCEISYNGGEYASEFTINVVDTKAPTAVIDHDVLNVQQYSVINDFSPFFSYKDLNGVYISFKTNRLDLNSVGTYMITMTVADVFGNSISKDITVNVLSESDSASGLSTYVDGSYPVVQKPSEKDDDSDENKDDTSNDSDSSEDKSTDTTNNNDNSSSTDNQNPTTPTNPVTPTDPVTPPTPTFTLPTNTATTSYFLSSSDANSYAFEVDGTVSTLTDAATGTVYYAVNH